MKLEITPSGQACGAAVRGADLSKPMTKDTIAAVRAAWLEHQVLAFPDQKLTDEQLEAYTLNFGPLWRRPFHRTDSRPPAHHRSEAHGG